MCVYEQHVYIHTPCKHFKHIYFTQTSLQQHLLWKAVFVTAVAAHMSYISMQYSNSIYIHDLIYCHDHGYMDIHFHPKLTYIITCYNCKLTNVYRNYMLYSVCPGVGMGFQHLYGNMSISSAIHNLYK